MYMAGLATAWVTAETVIAGLAGKRSRCVGAAVRITSGANQDQLGGFASCSNEHSVRENYTEVSRFGREKTATFRPVFSDDYEWRSGNNPEDAEMGNYSRTVAINLDRAVPAMVDYVVIFEVDGPADAIPLATSSRHVSTYRANSFETGRHGKNVGRLTKPTDRPVHAHDSTQSKHALLAKHLTKGLEVATEVGASAMVAATAVKKASAFARALTYGEEAVVGATEFATAAMPYLLMAPPII
jgi:hypothetical protein